MYAMEKVWGYKKHGAREAGNLKLWSQTPLPDEGTGWGERASKAELKRMEIPKMAVVILKKALPQPAIATHILP